MVPLPSTSQEKNGNVRLGGHQLQATGCDHRQLADLTHDRGRRAVADSILDHGQQVRVLPGMCVDDVGRCEAGLR